MSNSKTLDGINKWEDVRDNQGASKLLILKVVQIAEAENKRHEPLGPVIPANPGIVAKRKEDELIKKLIFYRDAKRVAQGQYGLDCSAFDSAIRHLIPRNYWEHIR